MKKAGAWLVVFLGAAGVMSALNAEASEVDVGQVVVTATRTEVEIGESPQPVSVITRQEIVNSPDRTIGDVLQRVPGVEVVQNGPRGSLSSAQIRGSEGQQVLILINGRRVNDAQSGVFDLSNLPVAKEDIERIEVLRGAASALYGADAMGGVINIITQAPSQKPYTRASASLGRFGTQEYSLAHRWKPGAFGYGLSFSRELSNGYRPNSDLSAWKLGGEVGYDFSPDSQVVVSARTIQKKIGVPGSVAMPDPDDRERDNLTQLDLTYNGKITPNLNLTFKGFQNIYRQNFDPGTLGISSGPPFLHKNYSTGGDLQATTLILGSHLVTGGVETIQDRVNSTSVGVHEATRGALYLQDEFDIIRPIAVTLGLRYDYHSLFQKQVDPRAAVLFRLPRDIRVRASVARSYRAPTFNDLFWPGDGFVEGNPNLQPEKAWSYELGGEKKFGDFLLFKIAGFYRDVKDLIHWAAGADYIWRPSNIQSADIFGGEAELTFFISKNLSIPVNYSYLYPRDEGTGRPIPSKPEHIINAAIEYLTPWGIKTNLKARYVQFYIDETTPTLNRDYLVLDAWVGYGFKVYKTLNGEVFLSLANILNRDYALTEGFPMPPRSLTSGVWFAF